MPRVVRNIRVGWMEMNEYALLNHCKLCVFFVSVEFL